MAYPQAILEALGTSACRRCGTELRPCHIYALEPHIALDHTAHSAMRTLIKARCPCGSMRMAAEQLDRSDLIDGIRELRLRANRPASRRDEDQAFMIGPPVLRRERTVPSSTHAPPHEITRDEVDQFLARLAELTLEGDETQHGSLLGAIVEAVNRRRRGEHHTPEES